MRYLHTMVRVRDIARALSFYCGLLGMREVRRVDNDGGRFTLVFLAADGDLQPVADSPADFTAADSPSDSTAADSPADSTAPGSPMNSTAAGSPMNSTDSAAGFVASPLLELTYNWDGDEAYTGGRNFGHLAYRVDDIYALCQKMIDGGAMIHRPPRDGRMAFVRSPDGISVELLQAGAPLAVAEPWASMPNCGEW